MTPSLGLINFPEKHAQNVGKHLLDHQFIIKTVTQEQWDGRDGGKGSTSMCSPSRKLSKSYTLGILMEAALCRHDWLNHRPFRIKFSLQPLAPLPGDRGWWGRGWQFQPSNRRIDSPGNPSCLGAFQKSPCYLNSSGMAEITCYEWQDTPFTFIFLMLFRKLEEDKYNKRCFHRTF